MPDRGGGEDPTPAGRGRRIPWGRLPAAVRARIEVRLGERVRSAVNRPGGFSPGLAARVTTASGRRFFLKAVGPKPNADAPNLHRREALIAAALPPGALAPRLLWTLDEGPGGWVVLAFEDAGGRPPRLPWREDELDRVVGAIEAMHEALTPSPLAAPDAGAVMDESVCGWRILARDRAVGLDPWSARHLDRLARLEAGVAAAVRGKTLVHMDLRADNLLFAGPRVWVVDWPHARIGAPWLDAVCMAPSVAMQGGPAPQAFLGRFASASSADPTHVDAAVCAIAGYFTRMSLMPPPPGLPTLRAFQAAQGAVARRWLQARLGLEEIL